MDKYYIKILDETKDEKILNEIVEHENIVFGDGSVGSWNIKPFTKYGKVYALIYENENREEKLVSVIEVLSSFNRELAYLYGVSTVPIFEKQGHGKRLLQYVINDLEKIGIKKIELTVKKNNKRAVYLYEKNGFSIEKELLDEYGDGEIRYLMKYEKK